MPHVLKKRLHEKLIAKREEIESFLSEHGKKVIHQVTLGQAYGGMRGIPALVWEPSLLDPNEGIRFRGYTIPELQEKLPRHPDGKQPLPEGLLFLLMTGDIPTPQEAKAVCDGLLSRSALPESTVRVIESLPEGTHPMTQFSIGIMSLQPQSRFAKEYMAGLDKTDYWAPTYEDSIDLLAKLPELAALIYRKTYNKPDPVLPDIEFCWAGKFAHLLGFPDFEFAEVLRLYLVLHADHEGGNVSAHASHLVGSALSDPYLALAAGMNGLAGPLHGLANQISLTFVTDIRDTFGGVPTKHDLREYLWDTLHGGQVIPGYGHAVLRQTDPRYRAQREFALAHMPDDELFQIVSLLYEVAPEVLMEHGKAKNPWPNVDAHSGVLLVHYGLVEAEFYTVLFGVSRAMGILTGLVWARGLGLPIERPKSFTTEYAKEHFI